MKGTTRGGDACAGIARAVMLAAALGGGATAWAGPVGLPTALRLQGMSAIGTGRAFQNFDRPVASAFAGGAGWWAFTGDLDGPTSEDDVLYAGDRLVLREGLPLVEGTGIVDVIPAFDGGRAMNAAGEVAAVVIVDDGETVEVVTRDGREVVRTGMVVPDGRGDAYESFRGVSILDDGRVGFMATTDGPSTRDSVIVLDGQVLFREGDPLPWDPDRRWDGRFDDVTWNGRGDLVFEGNTNLPTSVDRMLLLLPAGGDTADVVLLAQEGDAMSDRDGTVTLDLFEQVVLGEDGAWGARVLLRDIESTFDEAIIGPAGLIVREGDSVTAIEGASVGAITALARDGAGRVGFVADLAGTPPPGVAQGVFIDGALACTIGNGAHGLSEETVLAWIGFEDLAARPDGTFVFTAGYEGAEVGDGLFSIDAEGDCRGDLDGDASVGVGDLLLLLSQWGPCPRGVPVPPCPADLKADGAVDVMDLLTLLAVWGDCGVG